MLRTGLYVRSGNLDVRLFGESADVRCDMWEYEILHKETGERNIIFGYSWSDAMRRSKLNGNDYICLIAEYVD